MPSRTQSHALIDHEEIRRWAEERRARPACVRRTGGGGDVGMIRLDFPGFGGEESLEEISWDDWFRKFDESNLALLVQDTTARGEKSNFNKLVGRETAKTRAKGERRASRRRLKQGATARTRSSRSGAGSQRTAARGRRATSASGRSRATASTRGATSRGKRSSRRATASARRNRSRVVRGPSATRTQRSSAQKKTTRGASSQSRTRRKAA